MRECNNARIREDPLIIPLATPLIAGPSLLDTIMVLAGNPTRNRPGLFAAILFARCVNTLIRRSAPFFVRILSRRGIMAV